MSQGFQYYIIFTNQSLIYSKFISNIMNITERKVHKLNTLHLKCFPGFMQQLENLVFMEFQRFLIYFSSIFFLSPNYKLTLKICVRVFSGTFKARMLKLCIHMDNELLYFWIENQTPCSYAYLYLAIFLSFKATFVSQFSPELCKL